MSDPILENQTVEEQDEAYDTSDKEQVNKQRKKAARTRADRLKFVEAAMQHPEGRAWFYDILLFCRIFETPYIPGDPYATTYKCGMQNVGIRLLDDLQTAAPKEYMIMISENKTRKNG